jgi:hypothetical protein
VFGGVHDYRNQKDYRNEKDHEENAMISRNRHHHYWVIEPSGRFGSPCVSEIELTHVLTKDWANVVKWLNKLDLLRATGLEGLMLQNA